jgi:hypothetical protein
VDYWCIICGARDQNIITAASIIKIAAALVVKNLASSRGNTCHDSEFVLVSNTPITVYLVELLGPSVVLALLGCSSIKQVKAHLSNCCHADGNAAECCA